MSADAETPKMPRSLTRMLSKSFVFLCGSNAWAAQEELKDMRSHEGVAEAFPASDAFIALSANDPWATAAALRRMIQVLPEEKRYDYVEQHFVPVFYELSKIAHNPASIYLDSVIANLNEFDKVRLSQNISSSPAFIAFKEKNPAEAEIFEDRVRVSLENVLHYNLTVELEKTDIAGRKKYLEKKLLRSPAFAQLVDLAPDNAAAFMEEAMSKVDPKHKIIKSDAAIVYKGSVHYKTGHNLVVLFIDAAQENAPAKKEARVYIGCHDHRTPAGMAHHWNSYTGDNARHRRYKVLPFFVRIFQKAAVSKGLAPETRAAAQQALSTMRRQIGRKRRDLFPKTR